MISKRELRTLKWQLLLVGGLFMGCIVLAILMAIFHNLKYSRDHAASWLLLSSPIGNALEFTDGLRKAVTYRVLAPAMLMFWAAFSVAWREPAHARRR